MTRTWKSRKRDLPVALFAAGLALTILFGGPRIRLGLALEKDHAKSSDSHGHGSASDDRSAAKLTPAAALERLRQGSERFVQGRSNHPHTGADRREETARDGQFPWATIIGCSDSRAPVEAIFDAGVGDLFVIRVAGNVCAAAELASIEYGVEHLNTPVLVVLGHTGCGAVTAAVTDAPLDGNLPKLIAHIDPAVDKTKQAFPRLIGKELVPHAIQANVWNSVEVLFRQSDVVRRRVGNGQLQVIGAIYDLGSGGVNWLGQHPEQDQLLDGRPAAVQSDERGQTSSSREAPTTGPRQEEADEAHDQASGDDEDEEVQQDGHGNGPRDHDDDYQGGH